VKLLVHAFQPAGIDVGVPLCGGNACMAEHLLHMPEVDATGNKMGGETVPQCVW
jgi:hypothetical protein